MKGTFNILFYQEKNKVKMNGCAPLMVRVTINGKAASLSLKTEARPEDWDTEAGRVHGRTKEATGINSYIDDVRSRLRRDYRELCDRESVVTAAMVRDTFLGLHTYRDTLLAVFDRHNEKRMLLVGKQITKKTYSSYVRARKSLYRFLVQNRGVEDIALRDITHQFIADFEHFLLVDCGLHQNSTMEAMKKFKHVMTLAHNNGMLSVNPFASYQFRFKSTDRGYLSEDDMITLMEHPVDCPKMEAIRDIFVFCCFTGLSYIDVACLREDNIQSSFDGHLWILIKRRKTGIQSNVRLLSVPQQILEKYRGKCSDGRVLPVPSNCYGNQLLKKLGKLCGIETKVTFHVARHTFATTVTLGKEVPIESVSKMLGHKNIKTTQIYARIVNGKVSRDMDKLEFSSKLGNLENAFAQTKGA